ncbi:MAG: DUF1330 domain-containing protein [Pseudomonadota bacterium]
MTVYSVAQIRIKDRSEYDLYAAQFMDVFAKFKGTVLAADFEPKAVIGEWDADRLVLLSFPDEAAFAEWATSEEYKEIAKHRIAGADLTSWLAKGIDA